MSFHLCQRPLPDPVTALLLRQVGQVHDRQLGVHFGQYHLPERAAGMSMKASDFTCVSLTPAEHREYHRIGREAFELLHGISFRSIVKDLNRAWFEYSRKVK